MESQRSLSRLSEMNSRERHLPHEYVRSRPSPKVTLPTNAAGRRGLAQNPILCLLRPKPGPEREHNKQTEQQLSSPLVYVNAGYGQTKTAARSEWAERRGYSTCKMLALIPGAPAMPPSNVNSLALSRSASATYRPS